MRSKKDKDGLDYIVEEENYGARMDLISAFRSCVKRDEDKHGISYSLSDTSCIVNSCDGAVLHVTKHCDHTILTQTIRLLTSTTIKLNKRNLATSRNLLSIMSMNGKEDLKTMDNIFEDYFCHKKEKRELAMNAIGRSTFENVHWLELHNVKFTFAMHNRNWNRKHYPFLGCYCQRADSFKPNHTCRVMTDEENIALYNNAAKE